MQDGLTGDPDLLHAFHASMSAPRISRYLDLAGGDLTTAIRLYRWNALLAQSLYVYVQGWEVCLRNKLDRFLSNRYGANWPDDRAGLVRRLKSGDRSRLETALRRQEAARDRRPVPTPAIVADLSAGFWVSLLSKGYDVPLRWHTDLSQIFPQAPSPDRQAAWDACDRLLFLRNRIAHHEPILHRPLDDVYACVGGTVSAMCPGTFAFCEQTCTFPSLWSAPPGGIGIPAARGGACPARRD